MKHKTNATPIQIDPNMRKTRAATGTIEVKNMKEPEGLNFGKKIESRKTEKKKIVKQNSKLSKEEEDNDDEVQNKPVSK